MTPSNAPILPEHAHAHAFSDPIRPGLPGDMIWSAFVYSVGDDMSFTPAILQWARSRRLYPNCILRATVQIADWIRVLFMSLWRVVYRSVICFGHQRRL